MRSTLCLTGAMLAASLFGGVVSRVMPWDGAVAIENTGGGFAGGSWSTLAPGMSTGGANLCADQANCTKLWSLHKFSKGYVYNGNYESYTNHVLNFVGGDDIPIDSNALLAVSNSFVKCRANRGVCIPRFAYTYDGWGGCEPDDFEMIITHIRQLGVVLSQFPDVIPAVECGIIGAYGEMHTSRYMGAEYANRIVAAWLENTPKSMAVLVRTPAYLTRYAGMTTDALLAVHPSVDGSDFDRLGFFNDGYLGTDYDYGTWTVPNSSSGFSRSQGRAYLASRCLPYGGEFAGVSSDYFDANVHLLDTNRFNIVNEWYDTHLSYLRTIRASGMTITQKLASRRFSCAEFDFDGMPFLGEYDGNDLRTFCEDHMGSRLVVRGVRFVDRGGAVGRIECDVENVGFSPFTWPATVEVVISRAGITNVVSGTALAWRHVLPAGQAAIERFSFPIPDEVRDANVRSVGLRVRVPLKPFAFANVGCFDTETGVNALGRMVFDGTGDVEIGSRNYWVRSNANGDWTRGGTWQDESSIGARAFRSLKAESPLKSKMGGTVHIRMKAGWLAELPSSEATGPICFVCLLENEALAPYGLVGGAWHRLTGPAIVEGDSIDVSLDVKPERLGVRMISFSVNGAAYADAETGAVNFAETSGGTDGFDEIGLLGSGEFNGVTATEWTPTDLGMKVLVK